MNAYEIIETTIATKLQSLGFKRASEMVKASDFQGSEYQGKIRINSTKDLKSKRTREELEREAAEDICDYIMGYVGKSFAHFPPQYIALEPRYFYLEKVPQEPNVNFLFVSVDFGIDPLGGFAKP